LKQQIILAGALRCTSAEVAPFSLKRPKRERQRNVRLDSPCPSLLNEEPGPGDETVSACRGADPASVLLPASSYKGVKCKGRRFQARLKHKGVDLNLGTFDTADCAALAYDAKSRELGRPEELLNFPLARADAAEAASFHAPWSRQAASEEEDATLGEGGSEGKGGGGEDGPAKKRARAATGERFVHRFQGRFRVQLVHMGVRQQVGVFAGLQEAVAARNAKLTELGRPLP
jgi:hypothetical protein